MFKSKGLERDYTAAATLQPQDLAVDQRGPTPVSCIGAGMSIVGNVECSGPAQVFGKIEGELRATELVIGEGAQIEGSIQAQEVTISGRVKGTIRAIQVTLQGASVEGDVFHRTLRVDENSVFEGMSRRVDNPVERRGEDSASNFAANAKAKKVVPAASEKAVPTPSLVPSAAPASNGASQAI